MRRVLLVLGLGVAVAACGDDDDPAGPSPVVAEYTLEITGALTETATGPAYFGADVGEGGEAVWILAMGQDTSRHVVLAGKQGSARPGAGSYAIVDPSGTTAGWTLLHLVSAGEDLLGMYVAESGTITIQASSADEVRGTLTFEAVELLGESTDTIRVSGTFRAVPAPATASLSAALVGLR